MSKHEAAGELVVKIIKGLKGLPDNGPDLQPIVVEALELAGFDVQEEYAVKNYWRGHNGRVNIMALRGVERVAIELDKRSPRARSIAKLKKVDAYGILALRAAWPGIPDGVDAVVELDVRR